MSDGQLGPEADRTFTFAAGILGVSAVADPQHRGCDLCMSEHDDQQRSDSDARQLGSWLTTVERHDQVDGLKRWSTSSEIDRLRVGTLMRP